MKFRIWNTNKECWVKPSDSLHVYSDYYICPFEGTFMISEGSWHQDETTVSVYTQPTIIQPYIGIKDLDGHDIYVGDILLRGEFLYVIDFYEGGFIFPYTYLQSEGKAIHTVGRSRASHYQEFRESKIVGNIFENKAIIKL